MGRVFVVGSVNTDLVVRVPRLPAPGETIAGESFATYGGGKGANQAIAAARAGAGVSFVGAVGDDLYSQARAADLAREGIDTSALARRSGIPGGIALIQVTTAGENAITLVPGANATLSAAEVEESLAGRLGRGDVVCTQLEVPLAAVRAALTSGRRCGATTVLNATPFAADARAVFDVVDVLVVNRLETRQFAGLDEQEDDLDEAVRRVRGLGAGAVVVTLGADGALFDIGDRERFHVPAPEVEVVDTTAAGDAFIGMLAALLAEGQSWEAIAARAVWAGALAVQRAGAQPSLPSREDVEAAVRQWPLHPTT